jgi:hypothetical protein
MRSLYRTASLPTGYEFKTGGVVFDKHGDPTSTIEDSTTGGSVSSTTQVCSTLFSLLLKVHQLLALEHAKQARLRLLLSDNRLACSVVKAFAQAPKFR